VPQIQADPADAPEQTIDPSDQGTSSGVVPEQTTIISSQGKISITHWTITDELHKETIILNTQAISQLRIFHRQI